MAKFEPDKFMTMFKLKPSKDKIDALLRPALYERVQAISAHDHLGPDDLGLHFCDLGSLW